MKKKNDRVINKIYFNPKHKAGFGGKQRLIESLKGIKSSKTVSDWLQHTDTYTLHKPTTKRFLRRKYISSGINAIWQADLADLPNLTKENDNYRYILVTIDIFSRKAYARPLYTKSGKEVSRAFKSILDDNDVDIEQLNTDKGKEWFNADFKNLLKNRNINHYITQSQETKASLIERFLRTLKSKLFRYFTHTGKHRYVDVLQDFVTAYNNTKHSALGISPNEVGYDNQEEIWHKLYTRKKPTYKKPKFKVGDLVRISKYTTTFEKGYLPLWSEEVFKVSKIIRSQPVVYNLVDESGNELTGTFYEQELQLVKVKNQTYKIESVLGQRKINGRIQYLVKWKGYPSEFNSYVDKQNIISNYKN